jgi:glutaconate CoA-transferase subunit A
MSSTSDKVRTLGEAVRLIDDGDIVTFSGISLSDHPVAFAHEMIRRRKRNLEIAGSGAWHVNNLLIGAGCVNRMLVIADSAEIGGTAPAFRRAVEKGDLAIDDYSYYAIACMFTAGAIGVPFLPTKSMLGSDMIRHARRAKHKKLQVMKCPFTSEKVVLVPALKPDVAVIHAHQSDEEGNVQMLGPTGLVDEQARASRKVIVTVEKIVSGDTTKKRPELTIIPSFLVDTIVKVPYGAHPTALFGCYDYDLEHLKLAFEQSRNEQTFKRYLKDVVYDVHSHDDYLRRIGGVKRVRELKANLSQLS